ncbi:sporulation integral membrane protein YlbJ [Ferroacidibacillus organovorans]|uniref:Sporulation integral membrane protein YlbJ n=1 Tax=Ferroacidibacillus organovorans TaxID=1765683 RepID=A0A101XSP8_9BACL|nr:sporulation integral membrane protein YlbJ [Ferroacidibacillus organovorans]
MYQSSERRYRALPTRRKHVSGLLLAILVVLFTLALVIYPEQGFTAGIAGFKVFWDVVFPSLLPFFILSELLLGLGVVNALGVMLEPLMRPLFSVPGVGAFALSMGLAAGYPMDAVITARFRKNGLCSRIEGERLLAFTNTADPLFMFGAVAVGMFQDKALGILLALAHYASSFLVGLTFKLYGRREEKSARPTARTDRHPQILKRAYQEMIRARVEDNRPFGKLLGDSVNDSIRTLLMIGGFIVFFAVFIKVLAIAGIAAIIGVPFVLLFHVLHMNTSLVQPLVSGIFEIDIGSAATASASAALIQKVSVVSAIIAWSGLSVHAQVASVLTQTDIRMRPYFIARVYHAVLAAVLTYFFYQAGLGHSLAFVPRAISVMAPLSAGPVAHWSMTGIALATACALLALSLLVSLLIHLLRDSRIAAWYAKP